MEKGGVIVFLLVISFAFLCRNDFRQMYSGRAVLNAPTASEPRQTAASADLGAVAASKDVAAKIAAAAPLVMEALKECPKPIPPEMVTAFWARENDYCPGMPIRRCATSIKGAIGPTQIMPFNIRIYGKPGEDPETLAVGFKLTVRHLCFAKGKGDKVLDPASDEAILRYNNDGGYLKDIRRFQAQHTPVWASIRSGNGPVIAQQTTVNAVRVVDGPPKVQLFASNPIRGFAKWYSAYHNRRLRTRVVDGKKVEVYVPHEGGDFGCQELGQPVLSVCGGKVEFSGWLSDGLGGWTVIVACNDGQHRTSDMHLDRMIAGKGAVVTAGQEIGTCGTSGNAANGKSGPHVHFKLERLVAGAWKMVSPCAGFPSDTVLDCGSMFGPKTDFAPLSTMVASN